MMNLVRISAAYWGTVLAVSQTQVQSQLTSWGGFMFWLLPFMLGLIVFISSYVVRIFQTLQLAHAAIQGNVTSMQELQQEVEKVVHPPTVP